MAGRYAEVLLDQAAGRPLTYEVPAPWRGQLLPGCRVRVPLRTRLVLGTVTAIIDESGEKGIRPIHEVVDATPQISPNLLKLGDWMADYYCCSREVAMRALLPQVVRKAKIGKKVRRMVALREMPAGQVLERLRRTAPRQAAILDKLAEASAAQFLTTLLEESGATHSTIRALEKAGYVTVTEESFDRDPYAGETFVASKPLDLTEEQAAALERICVAIREPSAAKPVLLYGVTGSGKTEVYLRAIDETLKLGKTALVLVPEISLTPQTVERFKSRFADLQREVAVLHSHLTEGERYDEWHRIRDGRARIVIGARSAIFSPLDRLGLIVVDEEHESSYKQEEAPRYHARDLAVVRGRMEGCAVLLGSATPSLESYRNSLMGKYEMVRLTRRIDGQKLPLVRTLDLRMQNRKKNADAVLSPMLCAAIEARLQKGEQTILFLNRRGFSPTLVCGACGHVCQCPNCSVSLTYHRADERIVCHICGHMAKPPQQCPSCRDPGIRHAGIGTQRVEDAVRRIFPQARVARMDADTMRRRTAYRDTLADFRAGRIDILVGTQMIAKGLHFPNVTLVGIVNADLSLHVPDFRAGERTFQLLTQVAGRAGRGDLSGEVLVQTFTPHSPSIQFARHHDCDGFWEQELQFRKQFDFPPFTHMILMVLRSGSRERAEFCAQTLARRLRESAPPGAIAGEAAPAPLEKAHGQYRFHVSIRGRAVMKLSRFVREVVEKLTLPDDVHLSVDVDPYHLL